MKFRATNVAPANIYTLLIRFMINTIFRIHKASFIYEEKNITNYRDISKRNVQLVSTQRN